MDKNQQKPKQACEICKKKFGGVFASEHQCKRCLRTVCRQCCSKKKNVFTKTNTKMQQHRCCDICLPQSQAIGQYIKSHALVFNTLSKQGKQWVELAEVQVFQNKSLNNPRTSMGKSKLQGVYFHDIWGQMTPSLRELTGLLVSKISLGNVDTAIRYVGQKMGSLYSDLALPLIVYLLCHCDTTSSIKIACYLTKISNNYNEKTISSYIQNLAQSDQTLDKKSTKSLINYCKNVNKFYLMAYFANCSQIDIIHHIVFETLLSGDAGILELAMAIVIYQFRKDIISGIDRPEQIKNTIWQTLNLKNLQKSVKKLRKIVVKSSPSKQNDPKQQPQQQKRQRSIASLPRISLSSKLSLDIEQPPKQQKPTNIPNIQQISTKLQQAQQFLQKIQDNDVQQNITPESMEQLQKYLDLVIQDNQNSLKQYQQFQKMLAAIQGQLYGNTSKLQIQQTS